VQRVLRARRREKEAAQVATVRFETEVLSLYLCRRVEEGKKEGEAPRDVEYARCLPCQGGEELSPWKRVPSLLLLSKRRFARTSERCFAARFA
jgi:hypothetical protein